MSQLPTFTTPFDSRNASGFDSAVSTPFDSRRDQVIVPSFPIVILCDESVYIPSFLRMLDFTIPGLTPDVEARFDQDRSYNLSDPPFPNPYDFWDANMQAGQPAGNFGWVPVLANYISKDTAYWAALDVVRPNFTFHLVQPRTSPRLIDENTGDVLDSGYFAKGGMPWLGVEGIVEWGCSELNLDLLYPAGARTLPPEIKTSTITLNHHLVPDPFDSNSWGNPEDPRSFGLWSVPRVSWNISQLMNSLIPGGINAKTIQDIQPHRSESQRQILILSQGPGSGWFGTPGQPARLYSRSSWFQTFDPFDPLVTNNESPAFRLKKQLATLKDAQGFATPIKLHAKSVHNDDDWLNSLWVWLGFLTNDPKLVT